MGLAISGSSVVLLVVTVAVWDTALVPLCLGFAGLMAAQAFIFGNSSAVGLGLARGNAGAASAIQGLVQSTASAVSAPLATMGGGSTAVPMVVVMVVGVAGAWGSFQFLARRASGHEGGRLPA
jgi:DHA1 family bicyclomycin/chloramphenicol resistance-like MFS transporter